MTDNKQPDCIGGGPSNAAPFDDRTADERADDLRANMSDDKRALTAEREAEIRAWSKSNPQLHDLLAEVDRLRADNALAMTLVCALLSKAVEGLESE